MNYQIGNAYSNQSLHEQLFSRNVPQEPIIYDPVNCILPPTEREGGLFLGGIDIATDINAIMSLGISSVLTVAKDSMINYPESQVKYHAVIEVPDTPQADLLSKFEKAIAFIDSSRKETNVLVHCFQGISRSATILLVYLIYSLGIPLDQAYKLVRDRRKQTLPNMGFVTQIKVFEEYYFKSKPKYNPAVYNCSILNRTVF